MQALPPLDYTAYNKKTNSGRYRTKECPDKYYSGWKSALLSNDVRATVDEFVAEKMVKE
jgi:hypothetical protein